MIVTIFEKSFSGMALPSRSMTFAGATSAGWAEATPFIHRIELHPKPVVVDLAPPAQGNRAVKAPN